MISIDQLHEQLEGIAAKARQLVDGLSPELLTKRADPAKWSVAECLAHLNLAAGSVQPGAEKAIRRGREANLTGKGPFATGGSGSFFTWFAEPPPKIKIWAPRSIAPPKELPDPAGLITEFIRQHDEWARLLKEADGLDLGKIRMKSPFPGLPSFRVAGIFTWMFAHDRRHLAQAEEVKKKLP